MTKYEFDDKQDTEKLQMWSGALLIIMGKITENRGSVVQESNHFVAVWLWESQINTSAS